MAVTQLALDNDGTVLRANGVGAAPAFSVVILRLSWTAGVDLNQTAVKTTLFTVPTGRTFVPTQVVVRSPSATAANAIIGFGGDASVTDWASGVALTAWTAAPAQKPCRPTPPSRSTRPSASSPSRPRDRRWLWWWTFSDI